MSSPFIAIVRRLPNGRGIKQPRNVPSSTAVPRETCASNFRSYFRVWGKSITRFINYGSTQPYAIALRHGNLEHSPIVRRSFSASISSSNSVVASSDSSLGSALYFQVPTAANGSSSTSTTTDRNNNNSGATNAPTGNNNKKTRFTIQRLINHRGAEGSGLSMVTAYDAPSAARATAAGVDMLLVGDSVGMVMLGQSSTVSVTMQDIVHHCRAVRAGAPEAFVVADMPFGSYNTPQEAQRNAVRLIKKGGADAVKLEGGCRVEQHIRAIVDCGVHVIGHIGVTPQTMMGRDGRASVTGRQADSARVVIDDAFAVQRAGASAVVLELVPAPLAAVITHSLSIPTIGIGAGPSTTGQVLVLHDIIGLYDQFKPKFTKQYANLGAQMQTALESFVHEVNRREFPTRAHSFDMNSKVTDELIEYARSIPEALEICPTSIRSIFPAAPASATLTPTPTPTPTATVTATASVSRSSALSSTTSSSSSSSSTTTPSSPSLISVSPFAMNIIRSTGALPMFATARTVSSSTIVDSAFSNEHRLAQHNINQYPSLWNMNQLPFDRAVVLGGGALGSLIAARLVSQSNVRVSIITQQREHASAIESAGLEVIDPCGTHQRVSGIRVAQHVSELEPTTESSSSTVTFVTTKGAENTIRAAQQVSHLLRTNENNVAVTLQNGMGYEELIANELSGGKMREQLLRGVSNIGATLVAPGRVMIGGIGETTLLARHASSLSEMHAHRVVDLLQRVAGLSSHVALGIDAKRTVWRKLLANAVINPQSALFNVSNGALVEILEQQDSLGRLILSEALSVARTLDHESVPFESEHHALEYVLSVARTTAANTSSMLSDVQRGRSTEIDFINGYIARSGRQLGVPTPVNDTLVQLIKERKLIANCGRSFASASISPRDSPPLDSELTFVAKQSSKATTEATVVHTIADLRRTRAALSSGGLVGFVPTMGALHDGHLELVRQAKRECQHVVVSIFVNPTQFAAHEDLDRYPRTLERDLELLKQVGGVDVVFAPSDAEMYPERRKTQQSQPPVMRIVADGIEGHCHESLSRPGFFSAVATVVAKLFNLVQPDRAFFGQKDAVQCIAIQQLVRELNFATEIRVVDTVRESDGLAMSSRNVYLSPDERRAASVLYRSMNAARDARRHRRESRVSALRALVTESLNSEPLVRSIDYVSLADTVSGRELDDKHELSDNQQVLLSLAVRIGATRLIDNITI